MAFDDLLFMKFSGHWHYFQEGKLELSLITLAALYRLYRWQSVLLSDQKISTNVLPTTLCCKGWSRYCKKNKMGAAKTPL